MSVIVIIALIISGLLVGFINTLAGGGSIISLSLLMALGLPPSVANGTNRIAVTFQTLAGAASFNKSKILDTKRGLWLGIPTTLGSIVGAIIAVDINEEIFKKAMVVVMFLMIFFLFYKPEVWIKGKIEKVNQNLTWKHHIIFFFIGIYGGFIHVGVGYFLLGALVMGLGYNLVKANALKVFIVFLYVPVSLAVFIINGDVWWMYGLVHAIGNVGGAFIATHFAIKKGAEFVRWVLVVVVIGTTLDVFGLINLSFLMNYIK